MTLESQLRYRPDPPSSKQVRGELAGPRLDAWIACFVMKWDCVFGEVFHAFDKPPECLIVKSGQPRVWRFENSWDFKPSQDDNAAWDALEEKFQDFDVRRRNGVYMVEIFEPSREFGAVHGSFRIAASRAMVLAATQA